MKLYLYIALALALIGAGIYWRHLERKASERDAAVAELRDYRASVAKRDEEAAKEREAAQKRSEALALRLETVNAELENLRANTVKSIVYREKPAVDGKCADPRIGPDWLRVYNEAAAAASRAVHSPD